MKTRNRLTAIILIVLMLIPGGGASSFAVSEIVEDNTGILLEEESRTIETGEDAVEESPEEPSDEHSEESSDKHSDEKNDDSEAADNESRARSNEAEASKDNADNTEASAAPNTEKTQAEDNEESQNEEATEEEASPEEDDYTLVYECDEYTVTLEYGKDAGIPAGTTLDVYEIQKDGRDKQERKEYKEYHDQALDTLKQERAEDKNIKEDIASLGFARFFDITLLSDGTEIEPKGDVSVRFEFKKDSRDEVVEAKGAEDSIRVVHLTENEQTGELEAAAIDKKDTGLSIEKKELAETSFTTDSFSVYGIVYTVDFEYEDHTFSIEGESEVLLSEVFEELHIEENVDEVQDITFTDPTLIEVTESENDWLLTSLKPFSTNEELTVTLPDKIITIKVTDAARNNTFILHRPGLLSNDNFRAVLYVHRKGGAGTNTPVGTSNTNINASSQDDWIDIKSACAIYDNTYKSNRYAVESATDGSGNNIHALGFFRSILVSAALAARTSGGVTGSNGNVDISIHLNDNSIPLRVYVDGVSVYNDLLIPTESMLGGQASKAFTALDIAQAAGIDTTGKAVTSEKVGTTDVSGVSLAALTPSLSGNVSNEAGSMRIGLSTFSYPAYSHTYPQAMHWSYGSGTEVADNTYEIHLESAICKIKDNDGTEHPFRTLNEALVHARTHGNGSPMDASNPIKIEMLVDYVIPQTDKVTLNGASDNIIITTAATEGGEYNFTPTFTAEQGRSSDDSNEIAILQRGFDAGTAAGNSLFYLNNSSAKLKTEDITIDGGYATESQYKGRAVYVNNGDVCFMGGTTVENCHLESGSFTEGRGSAVYINNSGTHTIIDNSSDKDVIFRDCSVSGNQNYDGACINIQNGSAIINNSGSGTVLFERISGNSQTDGGAIGIEGSGDLTVNNTGNGAIRFVDCVAQYGGALETDSGSITLNNSGTGTMEFLHCYTDIANEGGAIYCGGKFSAVNNGTITFTGTIGTDAETNTKTTKGGAIYVNSSASDACSITGSGKTSFTNCKANTDGGAIYAKGSVTIDQTGGTSFANCTGNNGGGVYGYSTVSVTNSSFANCTALTGTGGGIHSANKLSVSDSTFTDCSAKTYGGAIYINGPNSTGRHTISNCTFDGHKDLDENTVNAANGGAIYVNDGWLTLTDSQFSDLTCTTNGGAVYMDGRTSDSLTIEDCTFDGHDTLASTVKNASAGGAVYMNADSDITLKNLTISDCWTSGNGGGVYSDDSITSISGTISIEDCYTTGGNGGGAYFNSTADLTGATAVTFKDCHADSTSASNGGGGAYFNGATTLDAAVSFEDCYTGGNGGAMYFANGGTMTGVKVDGHKTLDSATNNAAKGGAIFLANSKSLTISGGEIKNCSASNDNGGAINVGGSGAKVIFEGDAVVYDNKSTKDGQEVQANMVLEHNTNSVINTTAAGLGTSAHIGVYVTGNNANPYNSHGKESQPFGTAANVNVPGGMQNVDSFTNDRKETLFGVSSGDANDKLIYWSKPICKIIDTNPDGGTQIGTSSNYEHIFNSLNEAVTYARGSFNNGNTMSASNPVKIEMLVDYVIPERDKVTLNQVNDNIIITTAKIKSAAQAANETYYFEKSFTAAQGRQATDSDATAILKRGDNGASLFTVNNASASLSTEDIIFDGGGITANTHGGIVLGNKGAVTIKGGTTMRNSNVGTDANTGHFGGAVYSPNDSNGAVITIENSAGKTIEFINCTAGNGGAIKSYRKPITVTNNGTLNFVNCDARHGGALFTEYNGADISITNTGTMEFDDCDATSGVGGAIGAYTSTSNVAITNTSGSITFKDCSASSTGGAISANGAVSITGDGETSFSGCTSSTSGGGIYASGAVSINETGGTEFTKCSAVTGGAIYSGKDATLTNVTCGKANTADYGCTATDKGGCVYIDSGAATLTDCSFYYGKVGARNTDAQGGGVCYYGSNELKILGGVFDHCSTESSRDSLGVGNGGAVYVDKNATKLTVDQSDTRRSSFTDCSAHRYGGAIHWEKDGGTVEIKNADFTNCHSEIKGGGAVFADAIDTTISGCSFNGCYTESTDSNYGGGGAIYTNADNPTATSTISVSDTTFSDCIVKKNGGAMQFNSTGTSATLTNVSVDGHTTGGLAAGTENAELGSAIYGKGNLTIKQSGSGTSKIRNCSASGDNGGAVNMAAGGKMYFEGDVVVYDNTGTGALADQQKNVVLDEDTNTKIYTTSAGLGTVAHIGVYVTGTTSPAASQTQPFKSHGDAGDDFGTYQGSEESKANLDRFTNDRVNDASGKPLYGELCPDHTSASLIRWHGEYPVAPTAVNQKYLPYILILLLGAALAAVTITAKRRRKNTDEDPEPGSAQ